MEVAVAVSKESSRVCRNMACSTRSRTIISKVQSRKLTLPLLKVVEALLSLVEQVLQEEEQAQRNAKKKMELSSSRRKRRL